MHKYITRLVNDRLHIVHFFRRTKQSLQLRSPNSRKFLKVMGVRQNTILELAGGDIKPLGSGQRTAAVCKTTATRNPEWGIV